MQEFIGFPPDALAYNANYVISDTVPALVKVLGASVSPYSASVTGNLLEDLSGGVFDQAGTLVTACTQPRSDGCNGVAISQPTPQPASVTKIPKAVFGGFAFDHFGHFLLETTARLWCLPEYGNIPWLFLTDGTPVLRSYQTGFLEILGLTEQQVVPVSSWYQVDELIVPYPAFTYHHHVTLSFRDIFRRSCLPQTKASGRRIFLSRSNTTIARTIGEFELEAILRRDGWDIVIPELLPPLEQALLFKEDNVVMGLQGSAMHLGLFAPDDRRVIHLCRGAGYRGYYILDDLMQAQASYLIAMADHELPSKPISGPFLLDIDRTVQFLRDHDLLFNKTTPAATHREIDSNRLDLNYRAWWHYTESQTIFHRQVACDGRTVPSSEALEPALEALLLRPTDPEILAHAVVLTMKFVDTKAAAALLQRHEITEPQASPAALAHLAYIRSKVYDNESEYDRSLGAALHALELVPESPLYVNQIATALFRLARFEEAAEIIQALITKGTANSSSFHLMSLTCFARGHQKDGLCHAAEAMKMDPRNPQLCLHLAEHLIAADEKNAALLIYRNFLELNPTPETGFILAAAALEEDFGNIQEAVQLWHAAHASNPESADFRQQYLTKLKLFGVFPDLTQLGRPVSRAKSTQCVMVYQLSLDLHSRAQLDDAIAAAMAAIEIDPNNTTVLLNLLSLMMAAGRLEEARTLAIVFAEQQTASGEIFYVLSLIESKLGHENQARAAGQRAAELAPTNEIVTDHCRRLLYALGINQDLGNEAA